MSNLFESGDLFEASTRLESASAWITRLADGDDLDENGTKALQWAGELLECVDWQGGTERRTNVSPDTTVRATSVRPTFYTTLLRTREEFKKAGLENEDDVFGFLRELYLLLNGEKDTPDISGARLKLAAGFIHEISRDLLLEVCHNGLPGPEHVFTFRT